MTHKYDLVVFDWDGTLMDTTALIARGIMHAAKVLGYPVPSFEEASSTIGLGWQEILQKTIPGCPPSRYPELLELYRTWYLPNEEKVFLFPGARKLLEGLHAEGVTLAVATGKSRRGLDRVFRRTGLGPLFASTHTAEECEPKPHPDMLERIAVETGIDRRRTVMVGDTTHDLFMARNYGCDSIAMTQGAQSVRELMMGEPAALCRSMAELARALGVPHLLTDEDCAREKAEIARNC